jgi:hypothetical protein
MPTVNNLTSGEVVPQMGFAPTQNQNGGWNASRGYYMLASTWESTAIQTRFARGTVITTADPDVGSLYSFLSVESKTASYEDSGTVLLTVQYTGSAEAQFGGDGDADLTLQALPTYRLEGRLRDLPLSEHPKYKALTDADEKLLLGKVLGGDAIMNGSKAIEPAIDGVYEFVKNSTGDEITLTTADALSVAQLIKDGQTSFQAPTYVWIENTEGNTPLTAGQVNSLGLIDPNPRGLPWEAPGGREWMLSGASQEQQGDLYRTVLEWTASERGGWDDFLYTE